MTVKSGMDKALLRKDGMADTVAADIKKVPDSLPFGPVSHNLALFRRFGILGG